MARAALSMIVAFSSEPLAGSMPSSAAMPSAAFRVGTTATRLSGTRAAACWAASFTLGLFGSTMTWRVGASRMARSSSPVEGFADWPPRTMATTPMGPTQTPTGMIEAMTRSMPSPAATATTDTPSAAAPSTVGRDASFDAASTRARGSSAAIAADGSPVKAPARASRTSRAWWSRFSTLMRESVPSERP